MDTSNVPTRQFAGVSTVILDGSFLFRTIFSVMKKCGISSPYIVCLLEKLIQLSGC